MWEAKVGPLRFEIEHRQQAGDRGPTLRIRTGDAQGRELLRFDCFERGPHFHIDPPGRDQVTGLDPLDDTITFVFAELSRDLEGYLKRAGLELAEPLDRAAIAGELRRAEEEMRNPPADLDALELSALRRRCGEKWALYPPDVLPVWVADMDFATAEPIRRTLLRAIGRSDVGYPLDPWRTGLREAFTERMEERFGWSVDPERVEVISDVVQGIYTGLEVFSEPGEGVVLQTPIYPPFLEAVSDTGRRLVANPLVAGRDRFELDVDGLRRAVDGSTRILVLCNPHNPSGRVFTRPELEAVAEIAIANHLVVIADEIHQDLVFPGHDHIPFATLGPEAEARTVTMTSASKSFSIAGLRCAVAAFGSEEIQKQFLTVPRHLRGGIGTLGIQATLSAWRDAQPWLDRVLVKLEQNRDHVARFVCERWPSVGHFPPEATYLAWFDFRALDLEGGPGRFFLKQARVGLSNGKLFGAEGEGFVRFNFATSRTLIDEALGRMAEAIDRKVAGE
jgi:cystathionine beta-lyase